MLKKFLDATHLVFVMVKEKKIDIFVGVLQLNSELIDIEGIQCF